MRLSVAMLSKYESTNSPRWHGRHRVTQVRPISSRQGCYRRDRDSVQGSGQPRLQQGSEAASSAPCQYCTSLREIYVAESLNIPAYALSGF